MKWTPEKPVFSTFQPRLNVNQYKTDIAINFETGGVDLSLENGDIKTVSGFNNFVQKFKTVILANKISMNDFGLKEFLPHSEDQTLFNNECSLLASKLVSHVFSDSQQSNPNGLGYTIESINSIELSNSSNKLSIALKVTGIDAEITIDVPVNLVNHL